MPSIQYGNRQQVQYSQTDADERKKAEVRRKTHLSRLPSVIGNCNGPAHILPRHFSNHHFPEHLQGKYRCFPGFSYCPDDGGARRIADFYEKFFELSGIDLRCDSYFADFFPAFSDGIGNNFLVDSIAITPDFEHERDAR